MKNPYEVLGISSQASESQIKRAFRRLAKETHPDLNEGNPEAVSKFHQISDAYSILMKPETKKQLDESLNKNSGKYSSYTKYKSESTQNNYFDELFARQYIINLIEELSQYEKSALKVMWVGLAWLIGGISISYMSYSISLNSGGDSYLIAIGAIIFGGIQAIRGRIAYCEMKTAIKKYEQELWDKFDEIFRTNYNTRSYEDQRNYGDNTKNDKKSNEESNKRSSNDDNKDSNSVGDKDNKSEDVVYAVTFLIFFIFVIVVVITLIDSNDNTGSLNKGLLEETGGSSIEYNRAKISIPSLEEESLSASINVDQAIKYTRQTYENSDLNRLAYVFSDIGYDMEIFDLTKVKKLIISIAHYQKINGLEVDGMAGSSTMANLAIDLAIEKMAKDIEFINKSTDDIMAEYNWHARKVDNFIYFVSYDKKYNSLENEYHMIPYEIDLYKRIAIEISGQIKDKYRSMGFID